MSSKEKKPTEPITVADLAEFKNTVLKESADIARAAAKLNDGDPSNNADAVLEIVQSVGVIAATLLGAAAAAVYLAQQLGILGG